MRLPDAVQVARDDVVGYLHKYTRVHGLRPELGVTATRIDRPDGGGPGWCAPTPGMRAARRVVVATGYSHNSPTPGLPGLDTFPGDVRHSADYREAVRVHRPARRRGRKLGLGDRPGPARRRRDRDTGPR
jgi:cation diffusion facilitator CzcD-associated flavoprotein CzcO